MANIVYSSLNVKNEPMYGKWEHPIRALIEDESNQQEKNKTSLDYLWNIEKSKRATESFMAQSSFDIFHSKVEGGRAENDSVEKTYDKKISHITFAKEFTITREMMDDAVMGMGADMKAAPRQFIKSYYKTRTLAGANALVKATSASMNFAGEKVDLTSPDGKPLFHSGHTFATDKMKNKTQSNYFWGQMTGNIDSLEEGLAELANRMRNFADENGDGMGYVADTIIVPCNRTSLEMKCKKIVGSERTTGSNYNDINTQYGNWSIVILDNWQTTSDEIMIMSSEANKALLGNMFYNRVNLDIKSELDIHTRNFIWNGYCRFGLGFGSYKHILRFAESATAVTNATQL